MNNIRKSLLTALFSCCLLNSYADNTQSPIPSDSISIEKLLDEIVVSGHKNRYKDNITSNLLRLDGKLLHTPQNIQLINAKALADQQILYMSDAVVRNVSGATRLEHWNDLYTHITMRGTRAAAFRNGMNIGSTYGPLTEDMSFVEQIEFVKGPAGFMMANGEPSGIYNVVTKKPSGFKKGNASITLGSFDLYRASLDLDGVLSKNKRLLYRLNIVGQTSNTFRDYEENRRFGIAPVFSYQIDSKTKITAEYIYQGASLADLGTGYLFSKEGYGTVNRKRTLADPGIKPTQINDHNITLSLEHRFTDEWKLTAQASYFNFQQEGSFIWLKSIDQLGYIQRLLYIWDAKNESSFAQAFVNGRFDTGPIRHRLLGGIDMSNKSYIADFNQGHLMDSINTFNIHSTKYQKPYYGVGSFDRSESLEKRVGTSFLEKQSVLSIYLQDELAFFDEKLRLTLAGRYTYVKENAYGSVAENRKFTPRIGLNYSFSEYSSIYALFDQTFMPQLGQLRDGDKVKPLTGNNLEFGLKKDWFGGKWNTSLSVYRIIKNNQISKDPDNIAGENYVLQFGQTKTQGIEFDLKGEILPSLNLITNYAYTDSKITKSTTLYEKGTHLAGFAKHAFNTWLNYCIPKGVLKNLGLSIGTIYMADRSTWSFGERGKQKLPNYFRLDAALSWSRKKLSINFNINNILDKDLYNGGHHTGGFYYWRSESPRNFRLSTTYNF